MKPTQVHGNGDARMRWPMHNDQLEGIINKI
jgi:hypothetical protein